MGSTLVADGWLLELAKSGDRQAPVATKLLRMQATVAARTAHLVPLSSEYLRRRIFHAARYGHIASAWVACANCGTQATLQNWVDCGLATPEERAALLAEFKGKLPPETLAYYRYCPGGDYAADIAASERLPARRERG